MLTMRLSDWSDVRAAREQAGVLARAIGLAEPCRVEQAAAELGNNCLEHRDGAGSALLKLDCRRGKLILHAENPCRRRPTWQTRKPDLLDGFRAGGYGLPLVRALARDVRLSWRAGRVVVRAEFS